MSTAQQKVIDATDQGGVTIEVRDRVMLIGLGKDARRCEPRHMLARRDRTGWLGRQMGYWGWSLRLAGR
jgi:hypothetical protein